MNYAFALTGVIKGGTAGTWDYAHAATVTTFDETSINEALGLGSPFAGFGTSHFCPASALTSAKRVTVASANAPIDWNCNGKTTESGYSFDVNADPQEPPNTLGALTGHDDWGNLRLSAGSVGRFGITLPPLPTVTTIIEITPDEVAQIVPLDSTPPATQASASPPPNAAGWNNTAVLVSLEASDDASGVARIEWNLDGSGWTEYSGPVTIQGDLVHTLQYRAVDRALNVEDARSLTVRTDETSPTISFDGNAGTYGALETVSITCSASDALSGVASTTCAPIAGPAYSFATGSNSFSARATDRAGNVGTGTTSFTLRVTFQDLCALGRQFATKSAIADSLCAKLNAAESSGGRGNGHAQHGQLGAYRHELAAQSGKGIPPDKAAILTRLSEAL
jgi:hypothetical protein